MDFVNDAPPLEASAADAWSTDDSSRVTLHSLLGNADRVVICAPHPDDEVLGCGGLLALCAQARVPVAVISITDGEACYPDDPAWPPRTLRAARRAELRRALDCLGWGPRVVRRLAVPDGGIADALDRVATQLTGLIGPGDIVFSTAAFDGHPDHEATCRAARRACDATGAALVEYPIWAGVWSPIDARALATRERVALHLDAPARAAKAAALACFDTQLGHVLPAVAAPILPPDTVARFLNSTEVFFR